ncbi:efflux transporter, RND family, MFP subunit [Methylorubrum populi BJ001]|jgi:RND family efflux transporter MFP subunit|uniref:Efflux transporter, RND family, MFP subunit n=1 Tax=Methylorubrum populi (strain ATCC BAA-705 / NCIMB 13946 / BJ001) TaxID=441620 RepID=B1ZKV5_METPB|nr:efflux RND transporter periplasmic adaptor subunit [Methylorubrum populi]ACB82954.1 efflux transporter, RND family, MFP subunit [Methylorubrum populi BJ001]OAH34441.1 efflux transporter periplasmic adaptor subunit [Methylorubrum populi]PZP67309.1 MAG: efflux RND transporter periplasmic adaptor subunit [Methylorubrum populi]
MSPGLRSVLAATVVLSALVAPVLARAAQPGEASAAPAIPEAEDPSLVLVRVVKATKGPVTSDVVLTGDIQAQAQTNVAFRTNGKVAERRVEVGDHVGADQVLAVLEPLTQRANLDNARAALVSAEAQLTQAKVTFERQKQLISGGYTTRPSYDNAEQQLRTSQAAVDSARAALGTAEEQLSYTELRAGVPGIVMSRTFEVGQVVQAGQAVMVLAQDGPRDAVFNVYEALTAHPPGDKTIHITLQSDPAVAATGHVREISPTVDAASGTVRVKVGLERTPPAMSLGAVVIGRGRFASREAVVLPWSALYRYDDRPAVWIYDSAARTVSVRRIEIDRYGFDDIVLKGGVEPGETVVTAGIQFLRPGQRVALAAQDAGRVPTQSAAGEGGR